MSTNVQLKAVESNPSELLREQGAALDAWFDARYEESAARKQPSTRLL